MLNVSSNSLRSSMGGWSEKKASALLRIISNINRLNSKVEEDEKKSLIWFVLLTINKSNRRKIFQTMRWINTYCQRATDTRCDRLITRAKKSAKISRQIHQIGQRELVFYYSFSSLQLRTLDPNKNAVFRTVWIFEALRSFWKSSYSPKRHCRTATSRVNRVKNPRSRILAVCSNRKSKNHRCSGCHHTTERFTWI